MKASNIYKQIKKARASLDAMEKFLDEHKDIIETVEGDVSSSASLVIETIYLYAGFQPLELMKKLGGGKVSTLSGTTWVMDKGKFSISFCDANTQKHEESFTV